MKLPLQRTVIDVSSAGFKTSSIASQCVTFGNMVYPAGQVPVDPRTGQITGDEIQAQTRQCLENLIAVLACAGTSLDKLLKVNVYLRNMDDFERFNEVYVSYFPSQPPSRTTVQVARLWSTILIEIEGVACIPE
jgi:2-iminobutanoate/2-iminopropanoate deaminase